MLAGQFTRGLRVALFFFARGPTSMLGHDAENSTTQRGDCRLARTTATLAVAVRMLENTEKNTLKHQFFVGLSCVGLARHDQERVLAPATMRKSRHRPMRANSPALSRSCRRKTTFRNHLSYADVHQRGARSSIKACGNFPTHAFNAASHVIFVIGSSRASAQSDGHYQTPWRCTVPLLIRALSDAGAVGDGRNNDTGALQQALDKIGAARGGTLLLEEPPVEYIVRETLRIPKVDISIIGHGLHTAIVGRALPESAPVMTWKDSPRDDDNPIRNDEEEGHVDHGFLLRDLKLRRDQTGNVIHYAPLRSTDRWKGTISNVWLQQPNGGHGTLLHLERVLNCRIEGVVLGGGSAGSIGLYLKDGSNALVTQVIVTSKGQAPNGVLVEGGGQHHFSKLRTEGSGGDYSYRFVTTKGCVFESLKSEGDNETAVFQVNGCEDLTFLSPGIGTPRSTNPNGMHFENAKRCVVTQARAGAMRDVGSGHAFVIESDCEDISVNAFFKNGDATRELDDRGGQRIQYDLKDAAGRRHASGAAPSS